MSRYGDTPAEVFVCPDCRTPCDEPEQTYLDLWADAWCKVCEKAVTSVAQGPPDRSEQEAEEERIRASWPRSVEEAVERLLAEVAPASLDAVRAMDRDDLVSLHFTLGLGVRNAFGLWRGNRALLDSCAAYAASHDLRSFWTGHPDDASSIILEALWLRLQEPDTDDVLT
jgi:hypothetical protein